MYLNLIVIIIIIFANAIFVIQEVMEENKEADTTTGQASHRRITRGIHDKVCLSYWSNNVPLL